MTRGGKPKVRRGGGRNFSRHLELNEEGTAVATDPKRTNRDAEGEEEEDEEEEDGDEEEEESSEEESEEEEAASPAAVLQQQDLSRADRKALKKQGKKKEVAPDEEEEDADPLLANPNRTVGRMKISDLNAPQEPSRREREAKEKAEAKERYRKLHAQGKTEQAQKDLARLANIKAEREAAEAKRKAEAEAKAKAVESAAKKGSGRR